MYFLQSMIHADIFAKKNHRPTFLGNLGVIKRDRRGHKEYKASAIQKHGSAMQITPGSNACDVSAIPLRTDAPSTQYST